MKSKNLYLLLIILFVAMTTQAQKSEIIFSGTSTAALRGYMMATFPASAWKVEDGALVSQINTPNIDLVTKETFTNFDLTFEWRVSTAGNGGVFYNVQEEAAHQSSNGNSPNWLDNFEMQILDDINFNDKEPKRSAGSLYDLIAPTNKKLKPVGEYNTARLIVNNNHVEHWLNGVKVLEYEKGSKNLNDLIDNSKFKENPKFAKNTSGHIMFQHHGQVIWLKNIKVKRL